MAPGSEEDNRTVQASRYADHQVASRAEALDLLIEQEHKLLSVYDARQSSADGKAAAALTAAFALLTGALAVGDPPRGVAYGVLAMIGVVAVVAVAARVVPGVNLRKHRASRDDPADRHSEKEPFLYTEGEEPRRARLSLWAECFDHAHPNEVRELALKLWRGRAIDARNAAVDRDKWAGGTGLILAVAVIVSLALLAPGHLT